VVIVGAGFGGLYAARALGRGGRRTPMRVTVIDRKNHHTFQPLLYQVATGGLSPGEIAAPIRSVLARYRHIEVLLGEVTGFDLPLRRVKLSDFEIEYDYLIVAAGAQHSYFGHDQWALLAPGLKTIEDALEIRRRVLLAYELAERKALIDFRGSDTRPAPHSFVVVGGGATGVELAGTLAEIAHTALLKDFRMIDPRQTRIVLIEAGPRLLPAYPEDLSRSAEAQLRNLGVEVLTSTMVTDVQAGAVFMGATSLPSAVTLWAAGVSASPLGRLLGAPLDHAGRVTVKPDLSIPEHPEIFVIGDLAAFAGADGKLLPGMAPVAIQQGEAVAANIGRDLRGVPRLNFHYRDRGSLATIGRAAAVADFGRIHISGFVAWMAWLFVHIFFLIGFRNRLLVIIQWAWAYFTFQRGARLITERSDLPGWEQRATEASPDSMRNRSRR